MVLLLRLWLFLVLVVSRVRVCGGFSCRRLLISSVVDWLSF